MPELTSLLKNIVENNSLIEAVIHSPRTLQADSAAKITIRPIELKGGYAYHFTFFHTSKSTNQNLKPQEFVDCVADLLQRYKQAFVHTTQRDYHILISKKNKATIITKDPSRALPLLAHNRKKEYLLEEGSPIAFLVELGVMNGNGQIISKKRDKYRQINRFLEMVADVIPYINTLEKINIIDFGCGKAYLTFALYYFLKEIHNLKVSVTGLDLKSDVVDFCNLVARKVNFTQLDFQQGNIENYRPKDPVHFVVMLHACDTATDAAILKAVDWQAKVILAVPCCQHELFSQIKNDMLQPLLKHGILKERFAALITDAARAQMLEIFGYKTQVLEFIDLEHTPKNLLIRAVKKEQPSDIAEAKHAYELFKEALHINPYISNNSS